MWVRTLAHAALGVGLSACGPGEAGPTSGGATESATPTASTTASGSVVEPGASGSDVDPTASASATASPSGPLEGAAILRDATFLASPDLRGRGSGTPDEARAAAWLVEKLDAMHVDAPLGRSVPFTHRGTKSQNLLAVVGPTPLDHLPDGEVVFLGAHYDHLGIVDGKLYPGAEDNASGVALVLGVTRALMTRRAELHRPVVIAFFGAEEKGLYGSIELVKSWDFAAHPVVTMINIDMIGRPLIDQPGVWLAAHAIGVLPDLDPDRAVGALVSDGKPTFVARVRAAASAEGVRAVTVDDVPPAIRESVLAQSKDRGDYAPFQHKGLPFVFFSSSESSDYHQPTDTADKLDPEILEARAKVVLRFVLDCSNAPAP